MIRFITWAVLTAVLFGHWQDSGIAGVFMFFIILTSAMGVGAFKR